MTPEQRITKIRNNEAAAKADLIAAESEVQEIEAGMQSLKQDLETGGISSGEFRKKYSALESDLSAADAYRAVKATVVARSSDGIEDELEAIARRDMQQTCKDYEKLLEAYVDALKTVAPLQQQLFDLCRAIHQRSGSIAFSGSVWQRDLIQDLTTALQEEVPDAPARWPGRTFDQWADKYRKLPEDLEDLAADKARRNPQMEIGNA
jgi:hypothetical protein